jgi:predicted transcriptional regulator
MSNTKITNKTALLFAIDAIGDSNPEVTAKLQKMVEQLEKKNASPKKLTAQQLKNEELKEIILDFLAENEDKGFTVTDLIKSITELNGDSNQHVSALMRQLVETGKVKKYSEKRRTYFKIAG